MSEWYRTAFGAEYLSLYAHRDEAEAKQAVELILHTTSVTAGARVLDAPCGSGRHTRQFADRGMRATGLDLSDDLLRAAIQHTCQAAPCPRYVHADLRSLPFAAAQFDLVVNLFSSFGYFETDEENSAVMNELARVCAIDGHVVIDFMNAPRVHSALEPQTERRSPGGCRVLEKRWISPSPERVNKEIIATSAAGETKIFSESVRLFNRTELEQIMSAADLELVKCFGDYSGGEWSSTSSRLILVGRKR